MSDPIEVGVDLFELWLAGKVLLPQVASVYAQDNRDIHNTGFQETEAFTTPDGLSPVYEPWRQLRDQVELLFLSTATDVEAAGIALCMIATEYSQVDAAAAEVMQQRIAEYSSDSRLPQPPGPLQMYAPGQEHQTEIGPDGVERPVR